jgi:pimeloyl-ACP methyl ester carboxylesterase
MVRGEGDPVLLIHGLGSSGADWAMQVRTLERGFRVIIPDLPGCGHSGPSATGYGIRDLAQTLWGLLDELQVSQPCIVGFSLGGAVALEMALQRPWAVPRLGLINSLASYEIDDWTKWLEARIPACLIALLGMRVVGRLFAARLFPHPSQGAMRERAACVIGSSSPRAYLGLMEALEQWSAVERLNIFKGSVLMIAAEFDYTPLAGKRVLAARLGADLVVIHGSRHGTPFDSVEATNICLLEWLKGNPLRAARFECDLPHPLRSLAFVGSLAEEHALAG